MSNTELEVLFNKNNHDTNNYYSSSVHYLQPLSLQWRIIHAVSYLIGGLTFVAGSCYYLPVMQNYSYGSWLFTIGSAAFFYADLNEWWKNNRVGCLFDDDYRALFESQVGCYMAPQETVLGVFQRAENGLNFAFSAFGSFLYLIGSILFIPSLDSITLGTEVFIVGSIVIFLSQMWKIYRIGCTDETNADSKVFICENLMSDTPALGVDLNAGLGGFAYFIGSILFLPSIGQYEQAANWFVFGGLLFSLSGMFLMYRYFCTFNYPH
jgi:hypothetical protein